MNDTVKVRIPVENILGDGKSGFRIVLNGRVIRVAYVYDLNSWFTLDLDEKSGCRILNNPVTLKPDGAWQAGLSGSSNCSYGKNNSAWLEYHLPPVPRISDELVELPAIIHYVWIGDKGIPGELVARMHRSAARCPSYRFVIHVHCQTKKARRILAGQFPPHKRIIINDLKLQAFFRNFLSSPLGLFYRRFLEPATQNYGAASDILRLVIMHCQGGIYMDVDDEIMNPVTVGYRLKAAKEDILLNNMLRVPLYDFKGYGNSNFACCAGNPIIGEMLEEMLTRLEHSASFFSKPRPRYDEQTFRNEVSYERMHAYPMKIFWMTGPVMFSNVLLRCCSRYYFLEERLLEAFSVLNISPTEPRVIADKYLDDFMRSKAHYLPFSDSAFYVHVGSAHSWNPVKKKTHMMQGEVI